MSAQASQADDLKRLKWRCRRGLKELDVMLERFLSNGFEELSSAEKNHFKDLLEEQDLDLLAWFTGKSAPASADYQSLIALIRAA